MIGGMFLSAVALLLFTTHAIASCPTREDAKITGIVIEFTSGAENQYHVSENGGVVEIEFLDSQWWRMDTIQSVFLLRYGPAERSNFVRSQVSKAKYIEAIETLPRIVPGTSWQGKVSYDEPEFDPFSTNLTVATSNRPDLKIGACSYESFQVSKNEDESDGENVTTILAFLPELGFGVRVGAVDSNGLEKFEPISIGLVGNE